MTASFDDSVDRIRQAIKRLRDLRDAIDDTEDELEQELDDLENDPFARFLAEHPEIAEARILTRDVAWMREHNRGWRQLNPFDLVADREYVRWGRMGGDYQLRNLWLTREQVLDALARACRKERGPVTAARVAFELRGPDAYAHETHTLARVLLNDAAVNVDRTAKPNRYRVA